MTQAAGYALDLYCDADSPHHKFDEFPHTYTDEFGSKCRAMARRDGWRIDPNGLRDLCPKCNPHSAKFLAQ